MRRLNPLRLGLIALVVAIVGCDKEKQNAGASGGAGPEVRLGYFANVTHAQAVLGVANGDFQRAIAPAKLSPKVFNAGPSLIEALFAGEIDIGYVGPGPAINAHAKSRGTGIRVIAGAAANGVLIVARKDSGIDSLSQLVGKKIATPQIGNTQDISAKHYLDGYAYLYEFAGEGR
jgi:NitT/TauT family transport system substrate-binding protein